jgi:hypothetical protein
LTPALAAALSPLLQQAASRGGYGVAVREAGADDARTLEKLRARMEPVAKALASLNRFAGT